jgi:hypothetical protein
LQITPRGVKGRGATLTAMYVQHIAVALPLRMRDVVASTQHDDWAAGSLLIKRIVNCTAFVTAPAKELPTTATAIVFTSLRATYVSPKCTARGPAPAAATLRHEVMSLTSCCRFLAPLYPRNISR